MASEKNVLSYSLKYDECSVYCLVSNSHFFFTLKPQLGKKNAKSGSPGSRTNFGKPQERSTIIQDSPQFFFNNSVSILSTNLQPPWKFYSQKGRNTKTRRRRKTGC